MSADELSLRQRIDHFIDPSLAGRPLADQRLEPGDAVRVHALLGELWRSEPNSATAGFIVKRFDAIREPLAFVRARVAVARSMTLEPVVPLLRAAAFVNGIDLEVQLGAFNAYAQEILDPKSEFYAFEPDIAFLAVQARDISPELWSGVSDLSARDLDTAVQQIIDSFETYIDAFRSQTQADLVVHGLEQPVHSPAGLLGEQADNPLTRINTGLRQLASQRTGVWFLDYDALVARHGRSAWHDEHKWLTMRMPIAADCLTALCEEWLRFLHPLTGRVCKALVCDLDNTLWGGVIGEDGIDGIQLGVEYPGAAYLQFQRAILDLHQRGIILAICSKNNLDDAMAALKEHPDMLLRPEHFAAFRINWSDKSQNLREIANELNIGTDALAFVDDHPAECGLVRSQLSEVTVIELSGDPITFSDKLRECPFFERLTLSAEDRDRGRMYQDQQQRIELRGATPSVDDFLRSLEMKARFACVTPATLARTAQLTQKTNQFNLTTRRYSEREIADLAADPAWNVYTVGVADRFGDNGIVGVMITHDEGETWSIDTLLMSCRVIGRNVESAMLSVLTERAAAGGALKLMGWFYPTKKNAPAKNFYADHGFECTTREGDTECYEFDLSRGTVEPPDTIERQIEPQGTFDG